MGLLDATMSAYHPTLRDRTATGLLGLLGNPGPNSTAAKLIGGLLGSNGVGGLGNNALGGNGLIDLTPFGLPFMADEAGRQMASGHPIAGAANLAMALPLPVGAAARGAAKVAERMGERAAPEAAARVATQVAHAVPKPPAPIIAYHGSPYQFNKFDASKIGTGEGAQAYGHGLYFAENEDTAKNYRDKLGNQVSYRGRPVDFTSPQLGDTALDALGAVADKGSVDAALDWMRLRNPLNAHYAPAAEWLEANRPHVALANSGSMYQVGISAHPDQFLDWDAKLTDQHPDVQAALGPTWLQNYGHMTGGQTVQHLKQVFGGDQAGTAAVLSEKGVPGIKYLDQGSRDAGDGTRNYVVFNPDHVDILKRYGIPATVFGGVGAAAASQGQPDSAPQPDQGAF